MELYRAIDYIEKFAQESVAKYRWQTPEIHIAALMSSLKMISESGQADLQMLSEIQNVFNQYSSLLKVLSMKTLESLMRNKVHEVAAEHLVPIENEYLGDAFEDAWEEVSEKLALSLGAAKMQMLTQVISEWYEPVLVYCQRVLRLAVTHDICDKLVSEMYLYKEIEIFRLLKDDNE